MQLDQEKLLQDGKKVVKEQAYFMRRALQNASLRDGLKHSSAMLSELKTSQLPPKDYFQLFMKIFDELKVLENHFKEEYRRGRKIVDLYESVQHATSLLPRLYLLITVGSVYIQSHEDGSERVLDDLIEMLKTVQNPLRGIFVRYYFLKTCKDRLPDKGNQYETNGRTVKDAIAIIISNLQETNRLWIRLQAGKDRLKTQKNRKDLRILVGENILRISSLEGVSLEIYSTQVLPQLLKIVESCKDEISQNFLLDCIIQSFPDEFHIQSLQTLIKTLSGPLEPGVDVKGILKNLLNRLSDYAKKDEEKMSQLAQSKIYQKLQRLVQLLASNPEEDQLPVLQLLISVQQFIIKTYPTRSDYVNEILEKITKVCGRINTANPDTQKAIVKALVYPLQTMSMNALAMAEFPRLIALLELPKAKEVAFAICKSLSLLEGPLRQQAMVSRVLGFISSLIQGDIPTDQKPQNIQKQQQAVIKLLYAVSGQTTKHRLQLINLFFVAFLRGKDQRMQHTLQGTFFAIQRQLCLNDGSVNGQQVLQQLKGIANAAQKISPVLGLKLYLSLALTINRLDTGAVLDEYTFDILKEVLLIYTQQLTDNQVKKQCLQLMLGSFTQLRCISRQNYENIAGECAKYCSKLLKKPDQVTYLLLSCYLFLAPLAHDPERVLQIQEKVYKITAGLVKESPANLGSVIALVRARLSLASVVQVKKERLQRQAALGNQAEAKCEDKRLKALWLLYYNQAYSLLQ